MLTVVELLVKICITIVVINNSRTVWPAKILIQIFEFPRQFISFRMLTLFFKNKQTNQKNKKKIK